jgi:very-short-patch-repair endonuclease
MVRSFNFTTQTARRRELRASMPPTEVLLWSKLKGKQMLGCKFKRQYGVGPYIVDFYCPELRLAIELDGDSHFLDGAEARDLVRQRFIESFDIKFLRFQNVEVTTNLEGVLETIYSTVEWLRSEDATQEWGIPEPPLAPP